MNDCDERVFELLRRAVTLDDPVPPAVLEAGRLAFGARNLDAELAALIYDSWQDEPALTGVRAGLTGRQLTFEAADRLVEIELAGGRRTGSVVGQIVPPAPGGVELRSPDGSVAAEADQLGRFSFDSVPCGPMSLRLRVDGHAPVVTDWVVV